MEGAKWIWLNKRGPFKNCYARFSRKFYISPERGLKGELRVSVSDNYVLWLNGVFAACGQYKDYPFLKHYDQIELDGFLREGENILTIDVYYQGAQSFQCAQSTPRLWYELETAEQTVFSDENTLCRILYEYRQGEMENISPQLSYTFEYDARQVKIANEAPKTEFDSDWQEDQEFLPAAAADEKWSARLIPRPIKKCVVKLPVESSIIMQGVLLEPAPSSKPEWALSQNAVQDTPAKRIYYALTAPRYAHELITLPKEHPKPNAFASALPALPSPGFTLRAPENYGGCYIIADLGAEYAGYPLIDITAPEGTVLEIGYGEHLEDGRVRSYIGGRNFAFRYTTRAGRQRFINYFKRIAGRYLQMHIYSNENITIHHLSVLPEEYPLKQAPQPVGLNDFLGRRIWEVSVRTLQLCMHEHYEDCPWREQALYAMDARNQALAGYYAFEEYDFPAASWELMSQALLPDGQLRITSPTDSELRIPSFTFAWAVASAELAQYGGANRIKYMPALIKMLDMALERSREGLLLNPEGAEYWNFYEWSQGLAGHLGQAQPQNHPECPYNAFFGGALQAGAYLCRAFNDIARAEKYEKAYKALKEAFELFWDKDVRAYRTGGIEDGRPFSELTQALALNFGLVPSERAGELRARLARPQNGLEPITLSHYIYKIDALMQEEKYFQTVYEEIMQTWGSMLFKGATSFWETISGADAFDKAGSLCHGWSAAPIYFFGKWMNKK